MTDKSAIAYIREFSPASGPSPRDLTTALSTRLPYASDQSLNLLRQMIHFNPYLRPTVIDCLEHPFFESLRRPSFEMSAPGIINLEELDADSPR